MRKGQYKKEVDEIQVAAAFDEWLLVQPQNVRFEAQIDLATLLASSIRGLGEIGAKVLLARLYVYIGKREAL